MSQRYDVSLKLLFRWSQGVIAQALFDGAIVEWLNIELPQVQNPRVDLLARLQSGALRQVELQASNDPEMAQRMLEYYSGLRRSLKEHVEQVVLYVGKEPMRMPDSLHTPSLAFGYRLLDIREFDGEPLIESDDLGDNMLALLTRADQERVLRRVEERLREMRGAEQDTAAQVFMIISGLRGIEETVTRRLGMIDIMQNKVLGPALLRGEHKGRVGGLEVVLRERFGELPLWARQRLEEGSETAHMNWFKRVLRANSLEDVFAG